jgi:phosphoglucosamine mutase
MADLTLRELWQQKEQDLNGEGRVLVRASGTEPVIRVMIEGQDIAMITAMATEIADAILAKYGQ